MLNHLKSGYKRAVLIGALVLIVAGLALSCARIWAWHASIVYINTYDKAFTVIGRSTFADRAELEQVTFAGPTMSICKLRVHALSMVSKDYIDLMQEFEDGTMYLSEQMRLSEDKRFTVQPPTLKRLSLGDASRGRDDRAIARAAGNLSRQYRAQLSLLW